MKLSRSRPIALALAAGLVACGSARSPDPSAATPRSPDPSAASPPVLVPVPAKDSFSGQITAATGRFGGDHGNVKVHLQPGSGVTVRTVTVTFAAASCRVQHRCLQLGGKLTGKLTQQAGIPDVGRTFSLTARGIVKPLGRVTALGTVTGVGNVRYGHESLRLTLKGTSGTVVVSASSPQVPSFTSP
jgi:hypothetical protein